MTTPTIAPRALAEQENFRVLLNCMARPGTTDRLRSVDETVANSAPLVAIAEALLDHEVEFAISSDTGSLKEAILRRTGSHSVAVPQAGFVFADADSAVEALEATRIGDIDYPERGATLIVEVDSLQADGVQIELRGPGIETSISIRIAGLPVDFFRALSAKNSLFPLGVDTIFATASGGITCIPRTSQIEVLDYK